MSNIYDPASGSQQIDFFFCSLAASLPNLVKEISSCVVYLSAARWVAVFSLEKSVRLLIMEELPFGLNNNTLGSRPSVILCDTLFISAGRHEKIS